MVILNKNNEDDNMVIDGGCDDDDDDDVVVIQDVVDGGAGEWSVRVVLVVLLEVGDVTNLFRFRAYLLLD